MKIRCEKFSNIEFKAKTSQNAEIQYNNLSEASAGKYSVLINQIKHVMIFYPPTILLFDVCLWQE